MARSCRSARGRASRRTNPARGARRVIYGTPWERVICDESQKFANPKTQTYRHLMAIYGRHKWCLTGTPIRNKATDMWAQLRFCEYNGARRPDHWKVELMQRHRLNEAVLMVNFRDAGIQLPEKHEHEVFIEFGPEERACYDAVEQMTKDVFDQMMRGKCMFACVLALFTRLRQCAIAPHLMTASASRKRGGGKRRGSAGKGGRRPTKPEARQDKSVTPARAKGIRGESGPAQGRRDASGGRTARRGADPGAGDSDGSVESISSDEDSGRDGDDDDYDGEDGHEYDPRDDEEDYDDDDDENGDGREHPDGGTRSGPAKAGRSDAEDGSTETEPTGLQELGGRWLSKGGKALGDAEADRAGSPFIARLLGNLSDASGWLHDKSGTAGIGSSRMDAIVRVLRSVPRGEKVLVFSTFSTALDLLIDACKAGFPELGIIKVDGKVVGKEREELLSRFKTRDDVGALFLTYKVGSEGLNLIEATRVICMEPWWTNAVHDQAKARCWRTGQTEEVHVYNLYAKNSIEDRILEICGEKSDMADAVLQGTSKRVSTGLDKATLGRILGLRR